MSHPRIGAWLMGGGIIEVDWENRQVWKYVDKNQTHTFYRMENGNTMVPRYMRLPDDMIPLLRGGIPETEDRGMIWIDGFHEVAPDGKVVWEWSMADHLEPDVHVCCPLGYRGDFTHLNSCEVLPDGNILTSFRNMDTICIVDRPTGIIKWQWGPGEISHQHAPTMLNNGNILVFDNGAHRRNGSLISYSRVVEVNPDTNGIEWVYVGDPLQSFYSSLISGCQRLPNGNTLICEGEKGRVFEVTSDGDLVWQYVNPFYEYYLPPGGVARKTTVGDTSISPVLSNRLFRAHRYMPDYGGLQIEDLNPSKYDWVNRLYGPGAFAS
jgi:hypothetical protein